jgi:hypothetical protein
MFGPNWEVQLSQSRVKVVSMISIWAPCLKRDFCCTCRINNTACAFRFCLASFGAISDSPSISNQSIQHLQGDIYFESSVHFDPSVHVGCSFSVHFTNYFHGTDHFLQPVVGSLKSPSMTRLRFEPSTVAVSAAPSQQEIEKERVTLLPSIHQ